MSSWRRYWFSAGGRYSAAALRIAIAASILGLLWHLRGGHAALGEDDFHGPYRPIGILRLLPGEPGPVLLGTATAIAWAATIAMLVGWNSRTAAAISLVAILVPASYEYSFSAAWSHDNNAPLLVLLAFVGARGGDAWSIDAWWRRRRNQPPPPADHAYLWSVRLVQLTLGLMFASAAFAKLLSGGLGLDWVLSDNLRNQMLVRFDLRGIPRSGLAEFLLAEPVRWKVAAFLNLIAQLSPLVACFLVRRPWWRAAFGALFAIELVALDLVMSFWLPYWFPLTAAFVDWDCVVAWWQRRRGRVVADVPEAAAPVARGPRVFVAAFVAFDVVISFWRWPGIDQRIKAYPFSSFPMFAVVRAQPPYDEHHVYEMLDGKLEIISDPAPAPGMRFWIEHYPAAKRLLSIDTPERLHETLAKFRADAHVAFPEYALHTVRAIVHAIQAPAYPEPARLVRTDLATLGELDEDGAFRCLLAPVVPLGDRWVVSLPSRTPVRFAIYAEARLIDLVATRVGDGWVLQLPPGPLHVVGRAPTPRGERVFWIGER